ncbi:MAG: ABC transporter substrate-binding protein [Clostridiales bacterium]|nr:ABC transporter substrate-binding protein [Clostridiales bacterium]
MKNIRKAISILSTAALMTVSMLGATACDSRQELIIYNWGEYIAEDTIAKFEAAYPQYKVIYRTFETNETMYPNLDNTYDVIIPSEYMVCRLINEQRIQPLDWSMLPNVTANMDPMFNDLTYSQDQSLSDEVLDYAVPYLYCTVGLVYDANKIELPEGTTDPSVIWDVVFDEANSGNIGMYDSMRESIGVALNYLGYSINSMDENELAEAMQLLIDQKANLNPTYGVDNLKDKMASGEMAASIAWSGDHIVMLDRIEELGNDDIDLQFVLPEGSNWSVDMMCIPTNAVNYEGAHDFINFMYEPQIALENCEYVGYSTPNVAAKAMLDPEVAGNVYYYPTPEIFATLEVYYSSSDIEERYTEIWNTVKASA